MPRKVKNRVVLGKYGALTIRADLTNFKLSELTSDDYRLKYP
jgi:hypothetical protein